MKLELLALKWAMADKFREYLLGHKCVVYTDNNPLSHLMTAKLGAVEQRWAAQLASFDFELRYRSGKSNQNADALSRQQCLTSQELAEMLSGALISHPLRILNGPQRLEAAQAAVAALPGRTPRDLCTLQALDPVIQEVMPFWRAKVRPNAEERKHLSSSAGVLLQQWDHLEEQEGLLYRKVFRPDGGEAIFQLLLPATLTEEVLTQVHQEHGHQGVERTLSLLRARCYWPGMS